jgi:Prolyl oligopeptidase, N-terminal beta-propeller domain
MEPGEMKSDYRLGTRRISLIALSTAVAGVLLAGCLSDTPAHRPVEAKLVYPFTRQTNVVDTHFGTRVADPYRWLEDDNSPETKAWVDAENRVTFGHLAPILIRIETRAGHGAGKPTAKLIEEAADRFAFLVHELHMTLPGNFGTD